MKYNYIYLLYILQNLKRYECEDFSKRLLRNQCTKAKSDKKRDIQKNTNWEYFRTIIQQLLLEETSKIYRQWKTSVEAAFGHSRACYMGFALMAVNLRKSRFNLFKIKGKYFNFLLYGSWDLLYENFTLKTKKDYLHLDP
ncbi:transposase [Enterococcus faecalis]|nr:transposase [Enterococcus faecalis]